MDKLDYLILAELHKDGAMSFVNIAHNVNSTPSKVRRCYEKMKSEGIITGCAVTLNLARLGYQGKAFLLIHLTSNSTKIETVTYLQKIKNVFGVIDIIGPCDLIAIAPITDLSSLQSLLAEAKKAPHVQKVEFYCISDVYFPLGPNFDSVLNERCQVLANKTL
jgi:DNA-binding Lrp family transcriptional regulator